MPYSELIRDIRAFLSSRGVSKRINEKERFIKTLVVFFRAPEIKRLLETTGKEIQLFAHYQSSMGAVMTGAAPDYEVVISSRGMEIRRGGMLDKNETVVPWPASVERWGQFIPYGGYFHDSSSGDYCFEPDIDNYIRELETKVRALLK